MNEEDLKELEDGSGQNEGTDNDGRRPNGGTGTGGVKKPGHSGGKDQYSLRDDEETTDTPPVEGDDESDGE